MDEGDERGDSWGWQRSSPTEEKGSAMLGSWVEEGKEVGGEVGKKEEVDVQAGEKERSSRETPSKGVGDESAHARRAVTGREAIGVGFRWLLGMAASEEKKKGGGRVVSKAQGGV